MTTGNTDIDIIASDPTPLTLISGFEIEIQPLRTRALMSLVKILTKGASEAVAGLRVSEDMSETEILGGLLGATLVAIPNAENETIEFIQRMVEPAGLVDRPRTKAEIQGNLELQEELKAQLHDPDLDDLFTIVEQIIKNEGPHAIALGKRLAALIRGIRPQTMTEESKTESASKKPASSSKRAPKRSTQTTS